MGTVIKKEKNKEKKKIEEWHMSTFLNMIINLVMGLFLVMLKWGSSYSWKDEEILHFQDLISHMPLSIDVRSDAQLLISF